MRPVFLSSQTESEKPNKLSSGPGAVLFETSGPHTRIYRAPVRAIGAAKFNDKEVWGQVIDVGPGGCLFKTESTIEIGTELELRVTIIGSDHRAVAEVNGIIRRLDKVDGRPAYGVEFIAEDATDRRALQWLYAQAMR